MKINIPNFIKKFHSNSFLYPLVISSFLFLMYASVMPRVPLYSQARLDMLRLNPPDIYYGNCPKEKADQRLIPESQRSLYVNLWAYGGPTCLYIKKPI